MKVSQIVIFISALLLISCGDDQIFIPKPSTYLRPELPKSESVLFDDECPYSFEISNLFKVNKVSSENCHKDIDLGPLNGVIHFSYIDMDKPLGTYINFAIDKVGDHKVKASGIRDENIVNKEDKVFGTFFELEGDVASPFQFYLTDSTDHFVSGVVYFNSTPNYDSLKPSLEYLKKDLLHLFETFKWDK